MSELVKGDIVGNDDSAQANDSIDVDLYANEDEELAKEIAETKEFDERDVVSQADSVANELRKVELGKRRAAAKLNGKVTVKDNKRKSGFSARVTESKEPTDKVLSTSHKLSSYAINLLNLIMTRQSTFNKNLGKDETSKISKSVVLQMITTSTNEYVDALFSDRFEKISEINRQGFLINATSGSVSIIQPKLKINMSDEEVSTVNTLILSSIQTKVKSYSEAFNLSESTIIEFMIYTYIVNSDDIYYTRIKTYCEQRINKFIIELDTFINDSCYDNIDDDNALKLIAHKMNLRHILHLTKTNNVFKDSISHSKTVNAYGLGRINMRIEFIPEDKIVVSEKKEPRFKGIMSKKLGRKCKKDDKNKD